jgi:hypothetical protein
MGYCRLCPCGYQVEGDFGEEEGDVSMESKKRMPGEANGIISIVKTRRTWSAAE